MSFQESANEVLLNAERSIGEIIMKNSGVGNPTEQQSREAARDFLNDVYNGQRDLSDDALNHVLSGAGAGPHTPETEEMFMVLRDMLLKGEYQAPEVVVQNEVTPPDDHPNPETTRDYQDPVVTVLEDVGPEQDTDSPVAGQDDKDPDVPVSEGITPEQDADRPDAGHGNQEPAVPVQKDDVTPDHDNQELEGDTPAVPVQKDDVTPDHDNQEPEGDTPAVPVQKDDVIPDHDNQEPEGNTPAIRTQTIGHNEITESILNNLVETMGGKESGWDVERVKQTVEDITFGRLEQGDFRESFEAAVIDAYAQAPAGDGMVRMLEHRSALVLGGEPNEERMEHMAVGQLNGMINVYEQNMADQAAQMQQAAPVGDGQRNDATGLNL